MPRLVNSRSGVVVNVSDETAGGLTADWSAANAPAQTAAKSEDKPARRTRSN